MIKPNTFRAIRMISSSLVIPAPKKFREFLRDFANAYRDLMANHSGSYDEATLRNDFLNPLWSELGWDMGNVARLPQELREVAVERSVNVGLKKKRVDYLFRTSGVDRFICEAKKPLEELGIKAAYQAQRYAFNLKVFPAVLTNFGEIQLFIVGGKPDLHEPFRFVERWLVHEYVDRADELWSLFSRAQVDNYSLDAFVKELEKRPIKGKARQGWLIALKRERTVDADFLDEIEGQRLKLARGLLRNNSRYEWSEALLNECTQRIINRLLFLRICEDRDIDTGHTLSTLVTEWTKGSAGSATLYEVLVDHFHATDRAFNGALFHKGHVSEYLKVPDDFLVHFIEELSDENSPYMFNTLPVAILGSVYERFIGKVLKLKGNTIRPEWKPEIRKAGGVYYTPEYIVKYIVEATVQSELKEASRREAEKFAILDPACGSGSFVIAAFEAMCSFYVRLFRDNPRARRAEDCFVEADGTIHLTTGLKRQIATKNIFGIDIDSQAIEISMLSLYLKMLEGETRSTINWQKSLFPKERLLPDLKDNIVCADSLLSSDYSSQLHLEDTASPIPWRRIFAGPSSRGGFDVVLGNPPYGADLKSSDRQQLAKQFGLGTTDTAALMMVRAIREFVRPGGKTGFIVPKAFTYSSSWELTRDAILPWLSQVVDAGKVWKDVKLEQVIYVTSNQKNLSSYTSKRRYKDKMIDPVTVQKSTCRSFGIILNGVGRDELSLGTTLHNSGRFLGDIIRNVRGGMFQAIVREGDGAHQVFGGKQVQRFSIVGSKGHVRAISGLPDNSLIQQSSVLVQNIVAHIGGETDRIKITAAVPTKAQQAGAVILDTVNQIIAKDDTSPYFVAALLNSTLINWYVYRFIYGRAIRTMHFDTPVTDRIPLPNSSASKGDIERITDLSILLQEAYGQALQLRHTLQNANRLSRRVGDLAGEIDERIEYLFKLSTEHRRTVSDASVNMARDLQATLEGQLRSQQHLGLDISDD